jgi:hypothetical protein
MELSDDIAQGLSTRPAGTWPGQETTIVAQEKDDGVFIEPIGLQFGLDRADAVVHRRNHGGVVPQWLRGNLWKAVVVLLRHLQRLMRGMVGHVKEERLVPMLLDEVQAPAGEGVGLVFGLAHHDTVAGDRRCLPGGLELFSQLR